MKTKSIILAALLCLFNLAGIASDDRNVPPNCTMVTNVTYTVHVSGEDCPAFQYCVIRIVIYRQETNAEVDSQNYKYGEDEYVFFFDEIDNNYHYCAKFEIVGECDYDLQVTPFCHGMVPQSSGSYPLYPTYSCE